MTRVRSSVTIAAIVASVTALLAASQAIPQGLGGDAGKAADACAKSLAKAGAAHTLQHLKVVGGCADALFACLQTKPDGGKRDACIAKATAKCGGGLADVAAAEAKLRATVGKKCGGLALGELTDASGLGFSGTAGECAAVLGGAPASPDDVATCVARRARCQAQALLGFEAPRAKAILRTVGVLGGGDDPLACAFDDGGDAAAVGERATVGKALDKCERGARKAGAGFAAKKLKALGGCVGALFACEQRADDPAACRTKAAGSCAKAFAAIAAAEAKLGPAIAKACAGTSFAALAAVDGAHLGALAGECAQHGVAPLDGLDRYAECVLRQHACRAETAVAAAAPRAATLLAGVSLPFFSAFCPDAPVLPTATPGKTATRTPTPQTTATPGPGQCGNGIVDGAKEICDGAVLGGETCVTLGFSGGALACARSCLGFDSTACILPASPPPDPATVASEADPTAASGLGASIAFLFLGDPPIQYGVVAGTIDPVAAAVVRGKVLTAAGAALAGVEIRIVGHPEFGATQSRADGMFDLAVNGGGSLTVQYEKTGLLPAQRQVQVPWQQFTVVPDVRLVALDSASTAVDLGSMTDIAVARGNAKTDADGTRQATLLVKPGTAAAMLLPDGAMQPLTQITMRATEYTVGAAGPAMMPAPLPPNSGYTYAVDYTLDEALAAGASMVAFDQPIATYVENFPGFPAGTAVPAGFYDYAQGRWVSAPNGRVIDVVGITGGMADLDVTGDGNADTGAALADLGIDDAERTKLATLYTPGTSLWRVLVDHFSPWDYNWPFGFPNDATPPADSGANAQSDDEPIDGSCEESGSVLECENQVLGEDLLLAGTPYTLHYRSDRVPGRIDSVDLTLSGPSVPASLQSIHLRATVAGQTTEQSFPPSPNQSVILTWNGADAYGRPVQGGQHVTGTIDYVYPAVYKAPGDFQSSFAGFGGTAISANRSTSTITSSMPFDVVLREGITDARGLGLGGWTLDVQHFYDPITRTLQLGSGGRRRADSVARIIDTTLTSTGALGGSGTLASLAFAADGSMYYARFDARIRRRAPDGTETIVAGDGRNAGAVADPFGDGGPATQATLITAPEKLVVGADGSIYFIDNGTIRRVRPDGIIERLAGAYFFDGLQCSGANATPDGAVAKGSRLCIDDFAVAPDGTLVLAEFLEGISQYRIRRIDGDGKLQTIVGGGGECPFFDFFFGATTCGDGEPAAASRLLSGNHRIALGPDGTLYLSDANRVRKVTPDGIIANLAGSAQNGLAGDGFPASANTQFCGPVSFAFPADGSILIGDIGNSRIRRIGADGLVSTIAGSGGACAQSNVGQSGDQGPALQAVIDTPRQIALAPDGDLFVLAGFPQRIRRIGPPLPGFEAADILIASEDGSELYVFNANGKHVATFDAVTGAEIRDLVYDGDGQLSQIVEKTGGTDNVTTIQRNGSGQPTAIVGPFGKTTTLTLDGNGFLASITNPAGEATTLVTGASGLLTSYTAPGNRTSTFTFDASGRLLKDEDAGNGTQTLAKNGPPGAFTVTRTTALGRATTYEVEQPTPRTRRRTITASDGTQGVVTDDVDAGRRQSTAADGTETTLVAGPDPRFGVAAPVAASVSLAFPSTLTATATNARAATLSNPFNALSVVTLAEDSTVGGRTWSTDYTASNRTYVTTSPLGRTRTLTLDAFGRPLTLQAAGGATTTAAYDARGRVTTVTTGSGPTARTLAITYDAQGLPETVTNPLGVAVTMERDAVGRLTRKILPGGGFLDLAWNAAGDLASITPPGRPAHTFAYDARGLLTTITPPAVGGTGPTALVHDDDGALTAITRPDESITLGYDAAGRPSTVQLAVQGGPQGAYAVTYAPTTGRVSGVTGPGGATIAYTYDGPLLTGITWGGTVVGTLTRAYDARLAVTTETVQGSTVAYAHDDDDQLVAAGDLAITRDAATGLPATTTLGVVSDAFDYDAFGELAEYTAEANAAPLYHVTYVRDGLGRVAGKVETIAGVTHTYAYTYDDKGQLTEVERDSDTVESYTYDANGNRTAATVDGNDVSATYDAQDRLLTYGTTTFTHSASGRLATRVAPGGTTTYTYDAAGDLLAVAKPDGTDVAYALDPGLRRVARTIDGAAAGRFLWLGGRPIAELDGANALVTRFVFAGGAAPAYLVKNGVAHRVITDQAGSVRLVVNAATGAVAQRLDYDAFGRVVADSNPGFQPFGFAGGLYDPVTGLVRFDARDYDPAVGRWTAKDPIGFAGGDPNLYRYAGNDPVNLTDPNGLLVGEIALGIVSGLVDLAMLPQTIAHGFTSLGNAITEAITGIPQPVVPDPNPIVGLLDAINGLGGQLFDAEPLVDTSSTAFSVSRICSSVVASLGAGLVGGAARGAALGAEEALVTGSRGAAQTVARTADTAYRPLVSGKAAQLARLEADNARRIAAQEARDIARQAEEAGNVRVVRSEGGGAGTRGAGKPAGGFGIGR